MVLRKVFTNTRVLKVGKNGFKVGALTSRLIYGKYTLFLKDLQY